MKLAMFDAQYHIAMGFFFTLSFVIVWNFREFGIDEFDRAEVHSQYIFGLIIIFHVQYSNDVIVMFAINGSFFLLLFVYQFTFVQTKGMLNVLIMTQQISHINEADIYSYHPNISVFVHFLFRFVCSLVLH